MMVEVLRADYSVSTGAVSIINRKVTQLMEPYEMISLLSGNRHRRLHRGLIGVDSTAAYPLYLLFLGVLKFLKQLLNFDSEALIANLF